MVQKKGVATLIPILRIRHQGLIMIRVRTSVRLILAISTLTLLSSLSPNVQDHVGVRRNFLVGLSSASVSWFCGVSLVQAAESVIGRLDQNILNLPPPSYASEMNGVDNTYYPPYLLGDWEVEQTLVSTTVPLGLKFIGGPNADLAIAEKTMTEARSKIGIPIKFRLRYVATNHSAR